MFVVPRGFQFAGVSCGIKTKANSRDLTLIVSDQACVAAGVFTTNQIVAAPVVLSRSRTPSPRTRAVVVNSGCANACTGAKGMEDARRMTDLVAASIPGCSADQVLVMSTGVIGRFLPMDKIERGIQAASKHLGSTLEHFHHASDGILTTDASRKITSHVLSLHGRPEYSIAGMAKGAGMIGPRMATMLGCVVTDAPLEANQARRLLQEVINRSFNCISVEGHTSTNDTVLLLSSGLSQGEKALSGTEEQEFQQHLESMCIDLAKQIPDDGEGATHLIEIQIRGAKTIADAECIARSIAMSNLVKTAIHGGDPNWGRIVSAAGYAGVPIEPDRTTLHINGLPLFQSGEPLPFDAKVVSQSIRGQKLTLVELQVGDGNGTAAHWTSDLNAEYVRFNSEYTT